MDLLANRMQKIPEMLSFPFHSASKINEERKDCTEIQSDPGGSIKLELALDVCQLIRKNGRRETKSFLVEKELKMHLKVTYNTCI